MALLDQFGRPISAPVEPRVFGFVPAPAKSPAAPEEPRTGGVADAIGYQYIPIEE